MFDTGHNATANIVKNVSPRWALPYAHLCKQSTPKQLGPLGYPEERGKEKKRKRQREKQSAFMHGYQVAASPPSPATSRPGPCQLDLKWSRSEATARSCGFPLTLMPWVMPREPGNIICFTCHLIPLTYTNLYKQIPLFMVLISQNFLVCLPPKKFALLQNIRNVQELTLSGENNW